MPVVNASRIQAFETGEDFAAWLKQNHKRETELWLKIFKKGSGIKSITWSESVIEALCWGWIDGVKKSFDEQAYLQRFTPRRKGSNWSRINTEHVERLIKQGRMHEPGLEHVNAAKADGRWQAAYAPASQMQVPDDFLAALELNPKAKKHFETLTKASRYSIAYGLDSAKKAETRQNRFAKFMAKLESNEKFN